jgi:hypothetical protein
VLQQGDDLAQALGVQIGGKRSVVDSVSA